MDQSAGGLSPFGVCQYESTSTKVRSRTTVELSWETGSHNIGSPAGVLKRLTEPVCVGFLAREKQQSSKISPHLYHTARASSKNTATMTMSPTILRRAALRTNVRAFSHTARALEIQNQNPSYPAFKPRVRFYLGAKPDHAGLHRDGLLVQRRTQDFRRRRRQRDDAVAAPPGPDWGRDGRRYVMLGGRTPHLYVYVIDTTE